MSRSAPTPPSAGSSGGVGGSAHPPAIPDREVAEVGSLARELAGAYARMATFYRDQMRLDPADAERRARGADYDDAAFAADRERIADRPADEVSWWDLTRLAERDPEAMAAAWARVKEEARAELATGHRTARALEWGGRPWDRARFLALRSAFRAEWRPRGGVEAALVDMLAQSFDAYLKWSERLTAQAETEGQLEDHKRKQEGYWQPPRISVAAAMEQSAAMADRAHRGFLLTLRALQDLRRLPPVSIAAAGQVNIGAQQVNVTAPADSGEGR